MCFSFYEIGVLSYIIKLIRLLNRVDKKHYYTNSKFSNYYICTKMYDLKNVMLRPHSFEWTYFRFPTDKITRITLWHFSYCTNLCLAFFIIFKSVYPDNVSWGVLRIINISGGTTILRQYINTLNHTNVAFLYIQYVEFRQQSKSHNT